MNLRNQRRISAQLLKVGTKKVYFDPENLSEIKEAITKHDIRGLINQKIIKVKQTKQQSKSRTRKLRQQKRKGRRKGKGSRKGKRTARIPRKRQWIQKMRTQKKLIKELKQKTLVSAKTYKDVYKKLNTGFFRSRRHIKLYLTENKLFKKIKWN